MHIALYGHPQIIDDRVPQRPWTPRSKISSLPSRKQAEIFQCRLTDSIFISLADSGSMRLSDTPSYVVAHAGQPNTNLKSCLNFHLRCLIPVTLFSMESVDNVQYLFSCPPSPSSQQYFDFPTMQSPTLQNVRIQSTRDALQVFYAVARRILPKVTRRLDAQERQAITAGNVYVWEENGNTDAAGLERW